MNTLYVTRSGAVCPTIARVVALSAPKPTLPAPLKPAPAMLAKILQHPIPRKGSK